jgi:hypothetical protein
VLSYQKLQLMGARSPIPSALRDPVLLSRILVHDTQDKRNAKSFIAWFLDLAFVADMKLRS